MISSRELNVLNTATLQLYAPGLSEDNYIDRAFAFIASALPTDLSGYGALKMATMHLDAAFDHHPVGLEQSLEAYRHLMHQYEPFRFDPMTNGGKPYSAADFYSPRVFRDLDIYQEVHAPLGFTDHCFVHIPTEKGVTLFFGLFRSGGIFKAKEKRRLELTQPHLANARLVAMAQSATRIDLVTPDMFKGNFTPRECDVLFWLTQGKMNREIADLMKIRTDTVSSYLRVIYEKLGVENRVAATVSALSLARRAASNSDR